MHFKDEKLSKSVAHLSNNELNNLYEDYVKKNPIVSIEDPFDQDDW
jgi:enolase